MKRLAGLVIALAGTTACTTYQIRSAEDHGVLPVLKLETVRTSWTLFFAESEHQFWLCQDQGDDLVCHRSCGGGSDLQCPTAITGEGVISNTR